MFLRTGSLGERGRGEDAVGVFLWGTGSRMDMEFADIGKGSRVHDVEDSRFNMSSLGAAAAKRVLRGRT